MPTILKYNKWHVNLPITSVHTILALIVNGHSPLIRPSSVTSGFLASYCSMRPGMPALEFALKFPGPFTLARIARPWLNSVHSFNFTSSHLVSCLFSTRTFCVPSSNPPSQRFSVLKYKGQTPAPSEHSSRASFETTRQEVIANITEAPKNHGAAKVKVSNSNLQLHLSFLPLVLHRPSSETITNVS